MVRGFMSPVITIRVLPTDRPLPTETASVLCEEITDWRISVDEVAEALKERVDPQTHPLLLATQLEAANCRVRWQSVSAISDDAISGSAETAALGNSHAYVWSERPTVLALVPYWQCEPWLSRCLTSLCQQTHPLTHIVVIDDASAQPPLEIVQQFANVTLLVAPKRVGPYRLIQSVIDETDYDAYLFQDADDWSSCDRLETLLQTARTSGAELVGAQEIRVLESTSQLQAVGYPLDVNRALAHSPGHPLLHPTSLVTRSLVQRSGGFATGLTFGGDTEFLLRAHWLARVVNSPRYCYFRRKRPHSLTTAPETGLGSPARQSLTRAIKQQAMAYAQAVACGQKPDLSPLRVAPEIELLHRWGPPLRWLANS